MGEWNTTGAGESTAAANRLPAFGVRAIDERLGAAANGARRIGRHPGGPD